MLLNAIDTHEMTFILQKVSETLGPPVEMIRRGGRHKPFVLARHLAMYIILNTERFTCNQVAEFFECDHSSVIHGRNCIEEKLKGDTAGAHLLRSQLELIKPNVDDYPIHAKLTNASAPVDDVGKPDDPAYVQEIRRVRKALHNIFEILEAKGLKDAMTVFIKSMKEQESYLRNLVRAGYAVPAPTTERTKSDLTGLETELRQLLNQIRTASSAKSEDIQPIELKNNGPRGMTGKKAIGYLHAMTVPTYRCSVRTQDEDLFDKYGAWVSGYWVVRTNLFDQNWSVTVKSVLMSEKDNAPFVFIEPK